MNRNLKNNIKKEVRKYSSQLIHNMLVKINLSKGYNERGINQAISCPYFVPLSGAL
jgi:hypothetical protein